MHSPMNIACWTRQPRTMIVASLSPWSFLLFNVCFCFSCCCALFCHSLLFSSCISHVDQTGCWPRQVDQCCPCTGWLMIVALNYFWCLHWNGYHRGAVVGAAGAVEAVASGSMRQQCQHQEAMRCRSHRYIQTGFYCCFCFFWPPWLIVVFVFVVFQQPGIICIGWLIVFISFSVPP